MKTTLWENWAVRSEIAYSWALESLPTYYPDYIHLYNTSVPWGGDFNRAVGVKLADFRSFERVVEQVEKIHRERGLERPDRYDVLPPALEAPAWQAYLAGKGYRLETAIFFCAPALTGKLPAGFSLIRPAEREYLAWFRRLVKRRGYYEEAWFQSVKPLQLNFVKTFKPYWLMKDKALAGWVYCAQLGEVARLFEVEVAGEFRGQGVGKALLQAVRQEAGAGGAKHVLLQASEDLRGFYEKAGLRECARSSIIWLKTEAAGSD